MLNAAIYDANRHKKNIPNTASVVSGVILFLSIMMFIYCFCACRLRDLAQCRLEDHCTSLCLGEP